MTDYCQAPITHDDGIVICEAPATGTAVDPESQRPYPTCATHTAPPPNPKAACAAVSEESA